MPPEPHREAAYAGGGEAGSDEEKRMVGTGSAAEGRGGRLCGRGHALTDRKNPAGGGVPHYGCAALRCLLALALAVTLVPAAAFSVALEPGDAGAQPPDAAGPREPQGGETPADPSASDSPGAPSGPEAGTREPQGGDAPADSPSADGSGPSEPAAGAAFPDLAADAASPDAAAPLAEEAYANWQEVGAAVDAGTLTGGGFKPGGAGTADDPYAVATPEALAWIAYKANSGADGGAYAAAHIRLDADIDLAGAAYADGAAGPLQWAPLGTQDAPFRGVLDGNGHGIDNLCIDAPDADRQGLVGCADGAAVRNLSVSGSVAGRFCVGAIAAAAEGALVEGCSAGVDVSGLSDVGGLLGEAVAGEVTVRRSSHAGAVSGTGEVGGLACSAWAAGTVLAIEDCFHVGDVSSSGADGKACADGLLGRGANGFNGASVAIRDSYAAGGVSCSNGAFGVAKPRSDSGGTVAMENCYYDSDLAPGLAPQAGAAALPRPTSSRGGRPTC